MSHTPAKDELSQRHSTLPYQHRNLPLSKSTKNAPTATTTEDPDPFPVLPVEHAPIPPFAPFYVPHRPRQILDKPAPSTPAPSPTTPIVVLRVWKDYSYLLPGATNASSSASSAASTLQVEPLQLGQRINRLQLEHPRSEQPRPPRTIQQQPHNPDKLTMPPREYVQRGPPHPPHPKQESELQKLHRLGNRSGQQLQPSRRQLEDIEQQQLDQARERQVRHTERRGPPRVSNAFDKKLTVAENEGKALHRFFVDSIVEHRDVEPRDSNAQPGSNSFGPRRLKLNLPELGNLNVKPEPTGRSIIESRRPNPKFKLGSGGDLKLRDVVAATIRPKRDDFENVGDRNLEFRGVKRSWEEMREGESAESEEGTERGEEEGEDGDGDEEGETEHDEESEDEAETEGDEKNEQKIPIDNEDDGYDSLFDE